MKNLCQQLTDEEYRLRSEANEENPLEHCFAGVWQLFKPHPSPDSYHFSDMSHYCSSLSSYITKLDNEARILLTFVDSSTRLRNAVGKIAEKLAIASTIKYISKGSSKVLTYTISVK